MALRGIHHEALLLANMPEWMVRLRGAITTHKGFPFEMKIGRHVALLSGMSKQSPQTKDRREGGVSVPLIGLGLR